MSKHVVTEHPVVADGEHLIGASHEAVVCQAPPEYLICTHHERNPPGLSPAPKADISRQAANSTEYRA